MSSMRAFEPRGLGSQWRTRPSTVPPARNAGAEILLSAVAKSRNVCHILLSGTIGLSIHAWMTRSVVVDDAGDDDLDSDGDNGDGDIVAVVALMLGLVGVSGMADWGEGDGFAVSMMLIGLGEALDTSSVAAGVVVTTVPIDASAPGEEDFATSVVLEVLMSTATTCLNPSCTWAGRPGDQVVSRVISRTDPATATAANSRNSPHCHVLLFSVAGAGIQLLSY